MTWRMMTVQCNEPLNGAWKLICMHKTDMMLSMLCGVKTDDCTVCCDKKYNATIIIMKEVSSNYEQHSYPLWSSHMGVVETYRQLAFCLEANNSTVYFLKRRLNMQPAFVWQVSLSEHNVTNVKFPRILIQRAQKKQIFCVVQHHGLGAAFKGRAEQTLHCLLI